MKAFRFIVIAGWILLFLTVGLAFAFPNAMFHVLHPIASYFQLIPAVLLFLTFIYYVVRLYKAGMQRR
jgi:hypothetical protein